MAAARETILLQARGRKFGVSIFRDDYVAIRDFILSILKREKEITLTGLIERAHSDLAVKLSADIGWYVIHVKHDLESRDVIVTSSSAGKQRIQLIRLKKLRKGTASKILSDTKKHPVIKSPE
jgi:hypothetical protein